MILFDGILLQLDLGNTHTSTSTSRRRGVCVMGLRRLCWTAKNCGATALTLTDSMVACLAFEKGRSGSSGLNALCRRAAAYSIGCQIQWRLLHITTDRNVADEPSRRWGPDFERPSDSKHRGRRNTIDDATQGIRVDAGILGLGSTPSTGSRSSSSARLPATSPTSCPTSATQPAQLPPPALQRLHRATSSRFSAARGGSLERWQEQGCEHFRTWRLRRATSLTSSTPPSKRSSSISLVMVGCGAFILALHAQFGARRNIKKLAQAREKEARGVALALFTARAIRLCLAVGVHLAA